MRPVGIVDGPKDGAAFVGDDVVGSRRQDVGGQRAEHDRGAARGESNQDKRDNGGIGCARAYDVGRRRLTPTESPRRAIVASG